MKRKLGKLGSRVGRLPDRLTTSPANPESWRAGRTKTSERGYGWKWQKARATFLSRPENVLCRMCTSEGRYSVATVVDHIVPHRGDQALFWDTSNWQPLCKTHHDGQKAREEGRGGRSNTSRGPKA